MLGLGLLGSTRQVAVGDLTQQVVVMFGHDQAQVIDAGGRWWWSWLGLRHLAVHVATDDERNGWPTGRPSENTSMRVRSSGSKRSSTRRPMSTWSTA
jgi:hypothetical protein